MSELQKYYVRHTDLHGETNRCQHDCHAVNYADAVDARLALMQQPEWRCFHCGELCKSEVDARNHFGSTEASEPACSIKVAGEFSLLQALRNAEDQLQRYRSEDSDTQRAMYSMQSEHQQALRREEERGYASGVADMRALMPEWQPITAAPRDRYIAAWCPARRMSFQVIYRKDRNGWCVIGDRYPFPEEFTHWQEMPKFDESFVATPTAREER